MVLVPEGQDHLVDLEKKTILIVDNDKTILYSMKKALEKKAYNLFFADSGDNALVILKKEEIDFFLTALQDELLQEGRNG